MTSRLCLLLLLGALAGGGCNYLGLIAYKTMPPPKRPAAHVLARVPTHVQVQADARVSGTQGGLDAEVVALALERALQRHARVRLSPAHDAQQRVVVALSPASVEPVLGSDVHQGGVGALVRVVDAEGSEIWPDDGSGGYPVEATVPSARGASPEQLRRLTLRSLGDRIAELFYAREVQG